MRYCLEERRRASEGLSSEARFVDLQFRTPAKLILARLRVGSEEEERFDAHSREVLVLRRPIRTRFAHVKTTLVVLSNSAGTLYLGYVRTYPIGA